MNLTRLKVLRGERTLREVAEELNVAESSYSRYESGARKIPDNIKVKLADYYGCTVGWLFYDEGSAPDWYKLP